jgi:hypothetical protein
MTVAQPREDFAFDEDDAEPIVRGSDDRGRGNKRSGARAWESSGSGMMRVAVGGIIVAINLLIVLLLPTLLRGSGPEAAINWLIGVAVLTLLGFIFGATGRLGTAGVPDPTAKSRAFIGGIIGIIATGFWFVTVVLVAIIRLQIGDGRPGQGTVTMLNLLTYTIPLSIFLAFIGEAFHAFALSRINQVFGRDGMGIFGLILFILFLVFGAVFFVMSLISIFGDRDGFDDGPPGLGGDGATGMVFLILWLLSTIAYIVLLFLTRSAVMSGDPPPPRPNRNRGGRGRDDLPSRRQNPFGEDDDDRDRGRGRGRDRDRDDDDDDERPRRPRRPRDDDDQ